MVADDLTRRRRAGITTNGCAPKGRGRGGQVEVSDCNCRHLPCLGENTFESTYEVMRVARVRVSRR